MNPVSGTWSHPGLSAWALLPWAMLPLALGLCAAPAAACSCAWKGPFLTVALETPLAVRGKVLRHHPGKAPSMDVLVLEVLKGGLLDSGLTVQMGDGMHCRPTLDRFPPGTEWILALNGPGSKPGTGWALSHCGEYWLRVEDGEVSGSIDGAMDGQGRMSYADFRSRFLYPRFQTSFGARIKTGERFSRSFGTRFEFILEPMPSGWESVVREVGRDENLARLTPPLHAAPNPREIEGWHLAARPADCAFRPYGAEAGPDHPRRFIFSPEVGRTIDGPGAARGVTPEEIAEVGRFGRGTMAIDRYHLEPAADGCPRVA